MDDLQGKVEATILSNCKVSEDSPYGVALKSPEAFNKIEKLFKEAGYMKLPGNAQNITITTSDNPNDKLMTREQWEAEVGQS